MVYNDIDMQLNIRILPKQYMFYYYFLLKSKPVEFLLSIFDIPLYINELHAPNCQHICPKTACILCKRSQFLRTGHN